MRAGSRSPSVGTSGPPARAALEFFGPEHVLFGSDFGFSPTFLPETLDDIEEVATDEELKRMLYEGNARRLLRLGEVPAAA